MKIVLALFKYIILKLFITWLDLLNLNLKLHQNQLIILKLEMLLSFLVKFLYLKIRIVLYKFHEWKQK